MSFLSDASLVMIPSGYKDGTLYSAKPTNGDGDFTFSRGSNLAATRVNSEGLIEKGRENLVLQSNSFDTTWINVNSSETSGQSGYDGSNNAWLLTKTAANGRIYQSVSTSGVQTFSLYAKANDSNWISLWTNVGTSYFDLANGTKGSITASTTIDSEMVSVGNGWYRCSIIFNTSILNVRIYPADGDLDTSGSSGSIYIQDAQLEQGLVATDYIETGASTAQAGILEDMPRLDYSGGATCPSLLLESQRTNLVVNSEYYNTSDWNIGNATATNNAATSPEGVDNAIKLAEATTISSFHYIGESTAGVTTAGTYSISGFVKKGTRKYGGLRAVTNGFVNRYFVLIDLDNGSLATTNTFGSGVIWSHEIKDYGNGWYRIEIMGGHTSGTIDASFSLSDVATPSFSGGLPVFNGSAGEHIFCYGVQKELGSYPTSYIPTYGASVTRGVDIVDGAVDSNLFNDDGGVLFVEFAALADTRDNEFRFLISDGTNNERIQIGLQTSNTLYCSVIVSNSAVADFTTSLASPSSTHKVAIRYKSNDFAAYVDGTPIGTDTSGATPSGLDRLDFYRTPNNNNYVEANVKQTIYFNTALTDDELASLTTI